MVLAERYEVLDHLGSGGMASVWRGRDRRLNRDVAVKMLSEHLAADPGFRSRFEREALHIASLKHPNIVTVYDSGSEGDTYYIVMELVEGESLQAKLDATAGGLELELAERLGAEALSGLAHAHRKGIIHRDIKPANVLLTEEVTAKLADFGIARATDDAGRLTTTGSFLGTPSYASPEQLSGLPVTAATDLYSIGCVIYQCLAGRPPFEAEIAAGVIAQHLQATPRSVREYRPETPPAVEATLLTALEKDPARRFSSAAEMRESLLGGGVHRDGGQAASTVVTPAAIPSDAGQGHGGKRRPVTWLALAGAAAVIAAAVAVPLILLGGSHSSTGASATSQLASCESSHHLTGANAKVTSPDGMTTTFSTCSAPAPAWADRDGFSQITAKMTSTGLSENTGASIYDLVSGPCQSFKLAYDFGHMGSSQLLPAFVVPQGSVSQMANPGSPFSLNGLNNLADGETVQTNPPYPTRGQAVYIHNDTQVVDQASCLS
jgi:serine/threonine protein kinase